MSHDRKSDLNRAHKLRKEVNSAEGAQVYNRVFGQFTQKNRDAVKSIDHVSNIKEQEAEALEKSPTGNAFGAKHFVNGKEVSKKP